MFGDQVGALMMTHAEFELSFKTHNIGPDGKVHEEQFLSDEAKRVAANLCKTTSQLVRVFLRDESARSKLK
jgi:hypothetical protein